MKSSVIYLEIVRYIHYIIFSDYYIRRATKRQMDFTRNRKMSFTDYIFAIIKGTKTSLQSSIDTFFESQHNNHIEYSKQAFSKGRQRIKPEAFQELLLAVAERFYQTAETNKWRGYHLFGIDGTRLNLPCTQELEEIYLPAQNGAYYIVRFGINGIDSVLYCKGEAVAEAELESVECATEVVRTADGDIGKILEAAIPRSQISIGEDGMLAFNAVLYNKDGNGQLLTDTFSNVEVTDVNTWQRVFLTK